MKLDNFAKRYKDADTDGRAAMREMFQGDEDMTKAMDTWDSEEDDDEDDDGAAAASALKKGIVFDGASLNELLSMAKSLPDSGGDPSALTGEVPVAEPTSVQLTLDDAIAAAALDDDGDIAALDPMPVLGNIDGRLARLEKSQHNLQRLNGALGANLATLQAYTAQHLPRVAQVQSIVSTTIEQTMQRALEKSLDARFDALYAALRVPLPPRGRLNTDPLAPAPEDKAQQNAAPPDAKARLELAKSIVFDLEDSALLREVQTALGQVQYGNLTRARFDELTRTIQAKTGRAI
jgi:hypothetical protein